MYIICGVCNTLTHTLLLSYLEVEMHPLQWIYVQGHVIATFCKCWSYHRGYVCSLTGVQPTGNILCLLFMCS